MTGPDRRIATLDDARSRRSAEKRAAVEDAIEAGLRNKIERLETELRDARAEKAKTDRTAERDRGKAQ